MVVGTALQERLEAWAQRLNNLTVSPLTRDYPDTQTLDNKRAIEAFESLQLPKETQLQLQKLSGSESSAFTVFLTAFIILVARLTGDEDIAVGTSSDEDGRPFVIRVPIDTSETFVQLYSKVDKVRRLSSLEFIVFILG
jgi:L-aminoadipate-semialdehyde dehydrogenase